ncbi:MAG: hypothetical protein O3C27_14790 [Actinomycetota bacterium]|jgi:hypothetical protein|nr:hypothetical protein [Actinomycetota bacterium]
MTRLIVLLVLTAAAVAIALLIQRRRPDPPSAPSYRAPTQLDRSDFDGIDTPILLVVFASTTCDSCAAVWSLVSTVDRSDTVVERVLVEDDPERHRRYRIDGVPTTLIVDPQGVVRGSFFGPFSAEELREALPH